MNHLVIVETLKFESQILVSGQTLLEQKQLSS
jgi:hypothetical protein